jgi:hypothetical protein
MVLEVTELHTLLLSNLIKPSLVYILLVVHLGEVLLHALCLLLIIQMKDLISLKERCGTHLKLHQCALIGYLAAFRGGKLLDLLLVSLLHLLGNTLALLSMFAEGLLEIISLSIRGLLAVLIFKQALGLALLIMK